MYGVEGSRPELYSVSFVRADSVALSGFNFSASKCYMQCKGLGYVVDIRSIGFSKTRPASETGLQSRDVY